MSFRLAYFHLAMTNYKRQCQGHTHFDNEYLGNDERRTLILPLNRKQCRTFDLQIYI